MRFGVEGECVFAAGAEGAGVWVPRFAFLLGFEVSVGSAVAGAHLALMLPEFWSMELMQLMEKTHHRALCLRP